MNSSNPVSSTGPTARGGHAPPPAADPNFQPTSGASPQVSTRQPMPAATSGHPYLPRVDPASAHQNFPRIAKPEVNPTNYYVSLGTDLNTYLTQSSSEKGQERYDAAKDRLFFHVESLANEVGVGLKLNRTARVEGGLNFAKQQLTKAGKMNDTVSDTIDNMKKMFREAQTKINSDAGRNNSRSGSASSGTQQKTTVAPQAYASPPYASSSSSSRDQTYIDCAKKLDIAYNMASINLIELGDEFASDKNIRSGAVKSELVNQINNLLQANGCSHINIPVDTPYLDIVKQVEQQLPRNTAIEQIAAKKISNQVHCLVLGFQAFVDPSLIFHSSSNPNGITEADLRPKKPEVITFRDPKDSRTGVFANFSDHGITVDRAPYKTVEHFFQSQKFNKRPDIREQIINADTPMEALEIATKNKNYMDNFQEWINGKGDEVMQTALRAKFTQNQDANTALLNTGDAVLIEHINPGSNYPDTFWADGSDGTGQNKLGKFLMEVRDQLQSAGN